MYFHHPTDKPSPIDLGGSVLRQYAAAAVMLILGLIGLFTIEPWGRWGLLWWFSAFLTMGSEAFLPNGDYPMNRDFGKSVLNETESLE
jgi:hypothetical protein